MMGGTWSCIMLTFPVFDLRAKKTLIVVMKSLCRTSPPIEKDVNAFVALFLHDVPYRKSQMMFSNSSKTSLPTPSKRKPWLMTIASLVLSSFFVGIEICGMEIKRRPLH